MASSGYTVITFVANEQPTTAKWNLIGSNDASFNNGNGFEDGIIVNRHLASGAVKIGNMDYTNWPAVLATNSGSQTLTGGGAAVALQCNTEILDQGSNYNPSTYVFTAPATGVYEFTLFCAGANGTSSRLILGIKVNSTTYNGTQITDTYSSGITVLTIKLTAGDTVQPMASANPANIPTSTGVANCRFTAVRVA